MNNFSSFEELRNNALRYKGGRSDPYEFDEENGACSSNNLIAPNDYKINTVMKVYIIYEIYNSIIQLLKLVLS